MKKQSSALFVTRLALTLLAITALVGLALAGVNAITKGIIADAQAEKVQQAIEQVLPGGGTKINARRYTDMTGMVKAVYMGKNGYAVEVVPKGFNGEITMMVGVSFEGKVLGISVVKQAETAGLGALIQADNAKGEAFRNQFIGLSGKLDVQKDGGTVEAISGATITSRAVTEGVNAALSCVATIG